MSVYTRLVARVVLAVGMAAAGASCGGGEPEREPPGRAKIAEIRELGQFAFARGRYGEAARLFERGLERARARDDISAITDLGYERALADLRAGDAKEASTHIERLQRELRRRDHQIPASLDLVAAEAHYELGQFEASERRLERVSASEAGDPVTGRARYLLGMIAAARGNAGALAAAHRALKGANAPALLADRKMLAGELAMTEAMPARALSAFTDAADRRRAVEDKAGMATALARAGDAALEADRAARAADLYYRAGRTASLIGRRDRAEAWLQASVRAAETGGVPRLAADAGERLEAVRERGSSGAP